MFAIFRRARHAYRTYVADGRPQGRRPDLQGGGLVRSAGGWQAVAALRRGREAYQGDERVLGSTDFVERVRQVVEPRPPVPAPLTLAELVTHVCRAVGLSATALRGGSRRPACSRARAGIAYLWMDVLGQPGPPLAPVLGVHPVVVYQAARRGARQAALWTALLAATRKAN